MEPFTEQVSYAMNLVISWNRADGSVENVLFQNRPLQPRLLQLHPLHPKHQRKTQIRRMVLNRRLFTRNLVTVTMTMTRTLQL